ncbi:endomucin isoform X2 [Paroedura picta]|uniref:endomucin isoform X2 n=1 Tax=Paroedura picta TaxID=143630 RepID=UPI004055EDAD
MLVIPRITMKFFRMAFFSLAVCSLWSTTASAQETAGPATRSATTQAPPISSLTRSPASASTVSSLGNISVSSSNNTSQTTTTVGQILSTTNNSNSTRATHLLPPSSETAASKLTPRAIGPDTNTTGNLTGKPTYPESTSQNTTQPDSIGSDSRNTEAVLDSPSYTTILLPVIIALIVITLTVCILVALYRICWKTTPERQENETEHTSLDKENVKLISVKTTSPESGEHSSQGKNKTRQHEDSSSHLGNKCV